MVPFYIGGLFGARAEAHGYVSVDGTGVSIILHDGQIEDTLLEESTERIRVPWDAVRTLEVQRGRLRHAIRLRVVPLHLLQDLPGAKKGELNMTVQPKYGELIDKLERRVLVLRRGGTESTDVDQAIDDIQDFLDRI